MNERTVQALLIGAFVALFVFRILPALIGRL